MPSLDRTDLEILRLLAEDGRRPYNEIADAVGKSPPTVSDRVDRLRETGVIRRFTVDVDRSTIRDGVSVLVDVQVRPDAVAAVRDGLRDHESVEHVFVTADARVVFQASVPDGDVRAILAGAVDTDAVRDLEVSLLEDVDWRPQVAGTEFALDCAECGNTVTAEGETSRIDGDVYHFCCGSCRSRFEERYADLREGVEG